MHTVQNNLAFQVRTVRFLSEKDVQICNVNYWIGSCTTQSRCKLRLALSLPTRYDPTPCSNQLMNGKVKIPGKGLFWGKYNVIYKIPTLKYFWAAVWTFPTVAANNSSAVKLFTAGVDVSAHCSAGDSWLMRPVPLPCFGVGLNLLVQKAKQSRKV